MPVEIKSFRLYAITHCIITGQADKKRIVAVSLKMPRHIIRRTARYSLTIRELIDKHFTE